MEDTTEFPTEEAAAEYRAWHDEVADFVIDCDENGVWFIEEVAA